jgi:PKD repeat protein
MKKLFSAFAFMFLLVPMIWAQDAMLSVSGHVTDDVTGTPIQNHLVVVSVIGNGYLTDYPFFTDENGYYGNDSILGESQGQVRAGTFDCIGDEHAQEEYYNPGNYSFVFDFAICGDSIPPPGDCENMFWYETWDNLTFEFFGESMPMPADAYFWDFGDGSTGTGQQVSHTYDATNGELYTVSLTTVSFDPAAGDSCMATSTQEVWVGNGGGGDCEAAFSYVMDSTPNGSNFVQFTDESIGNPAYWMWDFADGDYSEDQNPVHTYNEEGVYVVCLTIMSDSMNSCYDTYCEEIVIGNGGGGNDCENMFWYETWDNLSFEFFGESIPMPADAYFWDFGDGSIGTGQQVSHTYDATNGEFYTVSLTTVSFDPAMGDSCMATSTQEVWVGNGGGGDCEAAFSYVMDSTPNGSNFVQFADESIGNPAYWMWDFGDGDYSEDQNPAHTYNEEGVYLVCLTIMSDSMNSCYDTYCEEIVIGNSGGGNDCESWFAYEALANNYVNFYGFSFPEEADEYNWDFGDGSFGSGQEVEHQYDPSMGDMFLVTLTTTIINDSIGETCTSSYTEEVWVFNGGGNDCENWFWYETMDGLTFEFYGESYPMAADYYSWSFGDGATASGVETEHTFDPANGDIQWVSLTTYSYDPITGDSCIAVSQQELFIGNGGGNDCENFFWYESDGNFTFDFYGESIPFQAEFYTWEFGDGVCGVGQQVTHTFDPTQGNEFTVCLTTYSSDPAMGDSCYAISCQEISIGGQMGQEISGTVSMGDLPADFAMVGLFGMGDDGSFIYEFTMTVPATGFYFFENVPDGEYYILASLTPQSPEFTGYFPTYYGDALFWFDAELVSLGDAANPYDIHLLDIENLTAGPGTINGTVTIGTEKGGAAENITVLLMDVDENALSYVQSNNEGLFDFSDLGYGTYKLKIEVPGVTSEIATVIIDEENQEMDLSFVLKGSSAYLSVDDRNAIVNNVGEIYPNPVAGNAKMEISLLRSSSVNLAIYNQIGQTVYTSDLTLMAGTQLIDLNTSDLRQGVYTVNLTDENGKTMRKKFVKIK